MFSERHYFQTAPSSTVSTESTNMSPIRLNQLVRSTALIGALTLGITALVSAQAPQADSTKVNARDRQEGAVTADQQKNDVTDRQATQKIRQSLMRDKGLSTYAHNVKVIAQDGQVTLKGPVRSDAERQTVEAKATEVVGAGHVVNELSVVPGRSKSSNKS
jgi:hyperosmotically inducible periplasmic protein